VLRPLLALTASLAVTATMLAVPAQAAPAAAPRTAGSTPAAERALAGAEAALHGGDHRDATLALRDLRVQRVNLSPADRTTANRMLARPGASSRKCFAAVCVHYSTTGADAASTTYVDQVGQVADHVLATYAAAGYRRPKSDGTLGGNPKLDIYLQDLGSQGLYGYCDSDRQPRAQGPYDTWAYCAFDNDYEEFPRTPLDNLEVTAAHELFHAVQFAYDYYEDAWFMEATATWAEDEVYDDVNDNLQYLPYGPMRQPGRSMDHFQRSGLKQYGDWIFFRYLTEHIPAAAGGLPTLVRQMWQRADGATGGRDEYSIQAVARTLAARGTTLRTQFARFAAANRRPATTYEEGRANHYPAAPLSLRVALSGRKRDSGWQTRTVDHLASATVRFSRATGMAARRLRLRLDLPAVRFGSGAVATVYRTTGAPQTVTLGLTAQGNRTRSLPFGGGVRFVEVTLANAGIQYECWRPTDTGYSCQGRPRDDNLPLKLRAVAVR
jgi:hypothetical protein